MRRRRPVDLPSVRDEVFSQPVRLAEALAGLHVEPAPDGSLLVGAGDSYAASIIASCLPPSRLLFSDPYVLLNSPEMARGRDVYFVSVSGMTRSNVEAAERVRPLARMTTAVTANPKSPLASATDGVVNLPYSPPGKMPGMLGFTMSLLALLRLANPGLACGFRGAFSRAEQRSGEVGLAEDGVTYFLGNGPSYGVAMYAAAKLREFLGMKAAAELTEEFSHMDVLSLSSADFVNVLPGFDAGGLGRRLRGSLVRRRFGCSLLEPWGSGNAEKVFYSVFLVQLGVLERALRSGLSHPRFLHARRQLAVSDEMIY